jgi:hypothetical protein
MQSKPSAQLLLLLLTGDQLVAAQSPRAVAANSKPSSVQHESSVPSNVQGNTTEVPQTTNGEPSASALSQSHVALLPLPDAAASISRNEGGAATDADTPTPAVLSDNSGPTSHLHGTVSQHTSQPSQVPGVAGQGSTGGTGGQCDQGHAAGHLPLAGPSSNAPSVDTSESVSVGTSTVSAFVQYLLSLVSNKCWVYIPLSAAIN